MNSWSKEPFESEQFLSVHLQTGDRNRTTWLQGPVCSRRMKDVSQNVMPHLIPTLTDPNPTRVPTEAHSNPTSAPRCSTTSKILNAMSWAPFLPRFQAVHWETMPSNRSLP